MGVFPIIHSLEMFLLRQREDGGPDIQRIDKILQEIELTRFPIFPLLGFIIIHGEKHLLVAVVGVIVVITRVVGIATLDHVLDKSYGRVITSAITLPPGLDYDLVQRDAGRRQLYRETLSALQGNLLCRIP